MSQQESGRSTKPRLLSFYLIMTKDSNTTPDGPNVFQLNKKVQNTFIQILMTVFLYVSS